MRYKFILMLFAILACPVIGQNNGNAKRVAILETVDKEDKVSYGVELMVRSKLTEVITATYGYEGYDRVDIASIMNEHEFQRTGLVSDADIKKLGEMTGADYILVAEVAYLNDSYIFLSAKILNVETARVERTANIQTQSTVDDLDKNCRLLAGKLLNVNVKTGALKGELMIDGNRYVGEHKDGLPHGKGIMTYVTSSELKYYEGDWAYGKREGKGLLIWENGQKYDGEWRNDCCEGFGIQYYTDGSIYEGYWLSGKMHGKGKMTYAANDSFDRKYYEGDWVGNVQHGIGTMVWNNGEKYIGGWKEYDFHGEGTYFFANGTYEEAIYENDVENGEAVIYYNNGDIMKGLYVNGKKDGHWKRYKNGKHVWTWVYKNGKRGRTIWPK